MLYCTTVLSCPHFSTPTRITTTNVYKGYVSLKCSIASGTMLIIEELTAKNVCRDEPSERFRAFFFLLLGGENDRHDEQQNRQQLHVLGGDTKRGREIEVQAVYVR